MDKLCQYGRIQRRNRSWLDMACVACAVAFWAAACGSHQQVRIAVIPQTEGTLFWEAAHTGTEDAADPAGIFIYWKAPTREDDVEAQIALVDRVVDNNYQGLVLAPDQALSLIMPVRRALAHGIPTVIIGSPLPIPAGGNLSYILNDDVEGGRLAAERVAGLLNGHGTVALLGINPDITGIMIRARAFEQVLAQNYPGIRIVEERMGSFNVPHEQQVAEDALRANPDLDVIVALMSTTVDGTLSALDTTPERRSVKVIGFDDAGLPPFDQKRSLDSVIQGDTRSMGQQAIELIHSRLLGQSVPATAHLHPKLITRDNINTPEVRLMFSQDWTLGRWRWSPAQ
ncbi:MAG: substrate-binding domain-containing protein [Terracidiphilus sp.]|jgi:ribose transport system substrate-binding protein